MRALLLCAGIGTRLRPLTEVLPKCLMPVNGTPLLGIWLDMLKRSGVSEIVVNPHHHADLVRDYVAASPYAGLVKLAEEPILLGTGGTLLRHRKFFEGAPALMAHADNLSVFEPAKFLEAHVNRPRNAVMTMMTFNTPSPESSGVVECDARGTVTAFHEKKRGPHGNLANAAIYLIERPVFEYLRSLKKDVIDYSTEVIPHFVGRIFAVHNPVYHRDIGTPMSLAQAQLEYPLYAPRPAEADPWYGLMARDGGRLARAFASRLGDTFGTLDRGSGATRRT